MNDKEAIDAVKRAVHFIRKGSMQALHLSLAAAYLEERLLRIDMGPVDTENRPVISPSPGDCIDERGHPVAPPGRNLTAHQVLQHRYLTLLKALETAGVTVRHDSRDAWDVVVKREW